MNIAHLHFSKLAKRQFFARQLSFLIGAIMVILVRWEAQREMPAIIYVITATLFILPLIYFISSALVEKGYRLERYFLKADAFVGGVLASVSLFSPIIILVTLFTAAMTIVSNRGKKRLIDLSFYVVGFAMFSWVAWNEPMEINTPITFLVCSVQILFIGLTISVIAYDIASNLRANKYELKQKNDEYNQINEELRQQTEEILAINEQLNEKNHQIEEQHGSMAKQKEQLETSFKSLRILNDTFQQITASLSIEKIILATHENLSQFMDVSIFGIGVYNKESDILVYPCSIENNEKLPAYVHSLKNSNQLGNWCFKNQNSVLISDLQAEYYNYVPALPDPIMGVLPSSVIYYPISYRNKSKGVITVQSVEKNAYTPFHLNIIRNLAVYIAISLENAESYKELQHTSQNAELAAARLQRQKSKLEELINELKATQNQLVQSEKMASLGQLVAGVAHEINTPLGAINASNSNIMKAMVETNQLLLRLSQELPPQKSTLFFSLAETIASHSPKVNYSPKETRKMKAELKEQLIHQGIESPQLVADLLLKSGFYSLTDSLTDLLKIDAEGIAYAFYNMNSLLANSLNIQMAVSRVSKIVFALKNFARKENSEQMQMTNVKENLETVLTLYQSQFKHGIELETALTDNAIIMSFPDELNQVWTNLLHNAIQAMAGKGTLKIGCHTEKGQVITTFSDSGKGIAPDIMEQIFEPFFTTKPKGEGTGLGLGIVKKIVEKHQGEISVKSTLGQGATFTVRLPELNPLDPTALPENLAKA